MKALVQVGVARAISRICVLALVLYGCGNDSEDTSPGDDPTATNDPVETPLPEGCTVLVEAEGDVQSSVQLALIDAKDGDALCFAEGIYNFTDEISLSVSGVTVRSAVADTQVIFDFSGQEVGANGMSVTGDSFTMDGITFKNSAGDGLRITNTTGVTIRNCTVGWDERLNKGDDEEPISDGAYGFYPVGCTNVLIEDSIVFGANDAGIYVGQSSYIIVRRNEAYSNVAGIEIENSTHAEVYDNDVHDNTAGILVFDLPELPISGGQYTEIHSNRIFDNNVPNFAPPGYTVAGVPGGTGMILAASKYTEIHNNEITNHFSSGIAIASIFIIESDYDDEQFQPYARGSYIYNNTLTNNGYNPQGMLAAIAPLMNDGIAGPLSQIIWDGYVDPEWDPEDTRNVHCIVDNGDADFINADMQNGFANPTRDLAPHDCTHETLAPVEF